MEKGGVTYLCGVPMTPRMLQSAGGIADGSWDRSLDKDEGEVTEVGYRLRDGRTFRRYIVKRIRLDAGEYREWIFVTNDHTAPPSWSPSTATSPWSKPACVSYRPTTPARHAQARLHGPLAWLLLVCLGHNLCCWT